MKSRTFAYALLAFALGACGFIPTPYQTFAGAPRANADVAVVFVGSVAFLSTPPNRGVWSFAVDGRDLGRVDPLIDLRGQLMSLTPGPHTLGISLTSDVSWVGRTMKVSNFTIDADLKAGMFYIMCPTTDGGVSLREQGETAVAMASVEKWQQTFGSACK